MQDSYILQVVKPQKVTIVTPTYNESGNVAKFIPQIINVAKKVKGWDLKVLVVDDNSPDGTANVVRNLSKKYKQVQLLSRKEKTGLGTAYLAGMKEAFSKTRSDLVITMDADLSHKPEYLPRFLKKIEEGADFIIGSRYIHGGKIPDEWPLRRKFLSTFGNMVVSVMLGSRRHTDWTSGYRAIKKEVYEKVYPQIKTEDAIYRGYSFNISFAYHVLQNGFKTAEVPIIFPDRKTGKSKLGMEYLIHTPIFLFKTLLSRLN